MWPTKNCLENRAELLKSNWIWWWPKYQSNSRSWQKRFKFSFSCWCGSCWYFLASVHFSDAQLVFWQSFINMFSFLEQSYIHFGFRCWSLRVWGVSRRRRRRHRTPNHFLSVFLLISAAIAFAIMWQNFPQQLRLRTLPTMSVCLLSLFFEHFFQLEIFTF